MNHDEKTHWVARVMLLARLGLGAVLLYAAYSKLKWDWISFAAAIDAHQVLPPAGVEFVARWLPWAEFILGAGLIIGWKLRWFAVATSILLVGFFAVLTRSFALGLQVDCGCFGPGDVLSWKTMLRDGALVAISIALTVASFRTRRPGINRHTEVRDPEVRTA